MHFLQPLAGSRIIIINSIQLYYKSISVIYLLTVLKLVRVIQLLRNVIGGLIDHHS